MIDGLFVSGDEDVVTQHQFTSDKAGSFVSFVERMPASDGVQDIGSTFNRILFIA